MTPPCEQPDVAASPHREGRPPSQTVAPAAAALTMKQRLSTAIMNFSSRITELTEGGGALVQIWMPEMTSDGTLVLSAQGLPFAVVGVGDLLALFRCVSVRYRFSTDVHKPALMGCIGRVFCSREPEMSRDVQKYDKNVYLRVSEAQRCRVHSTLVVPVFRNQDHRRPAAILELVQNDKECAFPSVMSSLSHCLEAVQLHTCGLDPVLSELPLRPHTITHLPFERREGQGDVAPGPAAASTSGRCGPARPSGGGGDGGASSGGGKVRDLMEDAGENQVEPAGHVQSQKGGVVATDGHQGSSSRRQSDPHSSHAHGAGHDHGTSQGHCVASSAQQQLQPQLLAQQHPSPGSAAGGSALAPLQASASGPSPGEQGSPAAAASAAAPERASEPGGAAGVHGERVRSPAGSAGPSPDDTCTQRSNSGPSGSGSDQLQVGPAGSAGQAALVGQAWGAAALGPVDRPAGAGHVHGGECPPGPGPGQLPGRQGQDACMSDYQGDVGCVAAAATEPQAKQRVKVTGALSRQLGSSANAGAIGVPAPEAAPAGTPPAPSLPVPQALVSWAAMNGIRPEALDALKALLTQGGAGAGAAAEAGTGMGEGAAVAADGFELEGPKAKQPRQGSHPPVLGTQGPGECVHAQHAPNAGGAGAATQPRPVPGNNSAPVAMPGQPGPRKSSPSSNKRQHWSLGESPAGPGSGPGGLLAASEGSAGLPLAAAPSCQLQGSYQQSEPGIGAHPTLAGHLGRQDTTELDIELEGGEDDVGSSSGGEDEPEDGGSAEAGGEAGAGASGNRPQRIGIGAGRRLRYEDLQSQFGMGLKEAAANLGICATTLKRACRRHGIKRWPRRQIAKLSRTLNQMGFQGAPPALLVQSAVKGQLGGSQGRTSNAGGGSAPKRQASAKALLQQAQQAQQQQQQQQQQQPQQLQQLLAPQAPAGVPMPMPMPAPMLPAGLPQILPHDLPHAMMGAQHPHFGHFLQHMGPQDAGMDMRHASFAASLPQLLPPVGAGAYMPAPFLGDVSHAHAAAAAGEHAAWQQQQHLMAMHTRIAAAGGMSIDGIDDTVPSANDKGDADMLWARAAAPAGGSMDAEAQFAMPVNSGGFDFADLVDLQRLAAASAPSPPLSHPALFPAQPSCSGTSIGLLNDLLGK